MGSNSESIKLSQFVERLDDVYDAFIRSTDADTEVAVTAQSFAVRQSGAPDRIVKVIVYGDDSLDFPHALRLVANDIVDQLAKPKPTN